MQQTLVFHVGCAKSVVRFVTSRLTGSLNGEMIVPCAWLVTMHVRNMLSSMVEERRIRGNIRKSISIEMLFSLSDAFSVQGLLVSSSIGRMLGGSDRKVMSTGEIFLGTHIEIIMFGIVQDAFQSLIRRNTDRSRR